MRLNITGSDAPPLISNLGLFNAPAILDAPHITRNQAGEISIASDDVGPLFFYTLDGTTPTTRSQRFTGPVPTNDGKVEVKAIAVDPLHGQSQPGGRREIRHLPQGLENRRRHGRRALPNPGRKPGHFLATGQGQADARRSGHRPRERENAGRLQILPRSGPVGAGGHRGLRVLCLARQHNWKLADKGEFSNIKNNRVWQTKKFSPVKGTLREAAGLAKHRRQQRSRAMPRWM